MEADEDHLLSCEDMAKILASEEGLRKYVGGRKYVAVLNQCDDDTRREGGEWIGEMLRGWGVENVVLTKLRNCRAGGSNCKVLRRQYSIDLKITIDSNYAENESMLLVT